MNPLRTFFVFSFLAVLTFALPACSKKGKETTTATAKQTAAAPSASNSRVDLAVGEKVYHKVCAGCHAAGIAGAPKVGDQSAWKDRIAKGMDNLDNNAIKGFQGSSVMPPKGGDMSLSDQEVKDAVAYMVQQSK